MFNYLKRYIKKYTDNFINNDYVNRYFLFVILYNYVSSKKLLKIEEKIIEESINGNNYLFKFFEDNLFSQDEFTSHLESNQLIDEKSIREIGLEKYVSNAKNKLVGNILDINNVDNFLKNTIVSVQVDTQTLKYAKILIKPAIYDQYIQNKIDLRYCIKFTSIFVILFVLYFFVYLYN